jgi:hypothetical protein
MRTAQSGSETENSGFCDFAQVFKAHHLPQSSISLYIVFSIQDVQLALPQNL